MKRSTPYGWLWPGWWKSRKRKNRICVETLLVRSWENAMILCERVRWNSIIFLYNQALISSLTLEWMGFCTLLKTSIEIKLHKSYGIISELCKVMTATMNCLTLYISAYTQTLEWRMKALNNQILSQKSANSWKDIRKSQQKRWVLTLYIETNISHSDCCGNYSE